jgi:hypothetical protein
VKEGATGGDSIDMGFRGRSRNQVGSLDLQIALSDKKPPDCLNDFGSLPKRILPGSQFVIDVALHQDLAIRRKRKEFGFTDNLLGIGFQDSRIQGVKGTVLQRSDPCALSILSKVTGSLPDLSFFVVFLHCTRILEPLNP